MNKRMRMKRRQAERKKIHKILDLVLEKNVEGEKDISFEYAGYINKLLVRVYRGGLGTRPESCLGMEHPMVRKMLPDEYSLDEILAELEAL